MGFQGFSIVNKNKEITNLEGGLGNRGFAIVVGNPNTFFYAKIGFGGVSFVSNPLKKSTIINITE